MLDCPFVLGNRDGCPTLKAGRAGFRYRGGCGAQGIEVSSGLKLQLHLWGNFLSWVEGEQEFFAWEAKDAIPKEAFLSAIKQISAALRIVFAKAL